MTDESYPEGFDTDPTSPGFVPGEEVEVVALDEPSMEDYPVVDEFGAAPVKVVPVVDGVQDSVAHRGSKS